MNTTENPREVVLKGSVPYNLDWRYKKAADLQATAWANLKLVNPNYKSKDVEDTAQWMAARRIIDQIKADEDANK